MESSLPKMEFEIMQYGTLDRLLVFRHGGKWFRKFNEHVCVEIMGVNSGPAYIYGRYATVEPWDYVGVEVG